MLAGEARIGGRLVTVGDYIETLPGERHRVEAVTETLLFVRLPQLPVYDGIAGDA